MSYWVLAGGDGGRRGVRGDRAAPPQGTQQHPVPLGASLAAGAPHRGFCPVAARPSGRCGTRCGGCGGGWRRACAAPAAIPREKPPRGPPQPGGSRWPADHRPPRTQPPRGRWQEGPGEGGWQQPPLVGAALCPVGVGTLPAPAPARPLSAVTRERLGLAGGQPGCARAVGRGMPEGTPGGLGGDSGSVPSTGSRAPRCGAGQPRGSHPRGGGGRHRCPGTGRSWTSVSGTPLTRGWRGQRGHAPPCTLLPLAQIERGAAGAAGPRGQSRSWWPRGTQHRSVQILQIWGSDPPDPTPLLSPLPQPPSQTPRLLGPGPPSPRRRALGAPQVR